jgi:energy-coupling factor transporter ATP-binding protein EcfA2
MPEPIPAHQPITVIFARDPVAAANTQVGRPAVAVVPKQSSWNDFGLYMSADLWVYPEQTAALSFAMNLMFEGGPRTDTYLVQLLGSAEWIHVSNVSVPFCSLLSEPEFYREIVTALGFAPAVTALRQLGDAVVVQMEGTDTARLALINSPEFHQSALRQDSTFVALRRGARYLRPQPWPAVTDAAASFQIEAQLVSADNHYEIRFDFEPDPLSRNRVSVLIGKNGSGKTQLLLSLIRGLSSDGMAADEPVIRFEPTPTYNRAMVFSSVASDPYPREIPPWRGIDYQYFSMIAGQTGDRDALTAALVDCLRDDNKIRFFHGDFFTPTGRMALLEKALAPLGIWASIYLPLRIQEADHDLGHLRIWNQRQFFPVERWRSLNEQRKLLLVQKLEWGQSPVLFGLGDHPRNLSSGEFAMLRFAAQAAGSVEPGSLFLFDEPETHLHPNFISDFMDVLHVILNVTRSVAIIATHSTYIVREVPRQRVRVLSVVRREVSVDTPRLQTFGAGIDSISQFVFGDTDVSHRYQSTLEEWVGTLALDVTIEQIAAAYGEVMNPETLSYVARLLRNRAQ